MLPSSTGLVTNLHPFAVACKAQAQTATIVVTMTTLAASHHHSFQICQALHLQV
jgi:hypothetical protein